MEQGRGEERLRIAQDLHDDIGARLLTLMYKALAAHAGVPVMPIIKANAYGHGLARVGLHLQAQGAGQLGVAFLEEGIALRQAGVHLPILVMGGIFGPQAAALIAHDLEITVSSIDKLRQVEAAAEALGRPATVHLKIDTGMERIGVHSYHAGPFIEAALASRWCDIKGIYSHLACADDPESPVTARQLERFLGACAHFERVGAPMPLRHLANSGGVLHFPDTCLDMVRPGIALYGVMPDPASRATVALKPALSLVSQVVYFKVVKAGRSVSYGATWTATDDTRVVTVPIGYGDGYPRSLGNGVGKMLLNGNLVPVIGNVCMDMTMLDITDIPDVREGDEVIVFGPTLSVNDVAKQSQTIAYELMTGISQRVKRIYFEE